MSVMLPPLRTVLFGQSRSPLLTGLVAQFKCNSTSGTLVDSVTGTAITAVNSPTAGTGKINGCRTYNGSNQIHTINDGSYPTAWDFAGSFAGSTWVNMAADASMTVVGIFDTSGNERQWAIERVFNTGWIFRGYTSANANVSVQVNGFGSTSTWYHLRWKFVAGTGLYLGVDNGAWSFTSHTGDIKSATTAPFRVGARGNGINFFNGSIDAIKLWNRIPSDDEFTLDYNQGFGVEL